MQSTGEHCRLLSLELTTQIGLEVSQARSHLFQHLQLPGFAAGGWFGAEERKAQVTCTRNDGNASGEGWRGTVSTAGMQTHSSLPSNAVSYIGIIRCILHQ